MLRVGPELGRLAGVVFDLAAESRVELDQRVERGLVFRSAKMGRPGFISYGVCAHNTGLLAIA